MIRLYVKIPEDFILLILQEKLRVVHIRFVRMVRFKFLAQFPVDHSSDSDVLSLIIFLCYFTWFAYNVIDRFVSIPTKLTFIILLHPIYSYFDMIGIIIIIIIIVPCVFLTIALDDVLLLESE